jgi:hypothetical protein
MTEQRRSLTDSLLATPQVPIDVAREFIHSGKIKTAIAPVPTASRPAATAPVRAPISTRIRADFITALKRASLERQLSGIEPNTLIDILEEAIEPWLRANGYID